MLTATARMTEAAIRATTETNVTTSVGSAIKLGCETDTGSKIRWNFNIPRRQLPVVLYSGSGVNSAVAWRVSVEKTTRGNEITVSNVTTADSGVYSCHKVERFSENANFSVTVKGTVLVFKKSILNYSINCDRTFFHFYPRDIVSAVYATAT